MKGIVEDLKARWMRKVDADADLRQSITRALQFSTLSLLAMAVCGTVVSGFIAFRSQDAAIIQIAAAMLAITLARLFEDHADRRWPRTPAA